MLDIRIDGLVDLGRRLAYAEAEIGFAIGTAVAVACAEGANEARTLHRYKDQTGDLTRSIDGRLTGTIRGGGEGEMVATMPYASFVENGTRPHEIWPKRAKRLAWQEVAGDWHFARMVHHPGTQPYGFMGQAHDKCERVLIREIEDSVTRIAQRIAGR